MSRTRACQEAPRLFAREELVLRATGQARFRAMVRRPSLPLSEIERRKDEDRATMAKLREWGIELAGSFQLRWKCLLAERAGVVDHYGICYEDGEIRIRLRHATTGRLLKESSLVDTLCHEIAHLRHLDHSERFERHADPPQLLLNSAVTTIAGL